MMPAKGRLAQFFSLAALLFVAGMAMAGAMLPDLALEMKLRQIAPQRFIVNIVEHNRGRATAPAHRIGFFVRKGTRVLYHKRLIRSKPLPAGARRKHLTRFTIPANIAPGRYLLCARTDDEQRLREVTRSNNSVCRPVVTLRLPDLNPRINVKRAGKHRLRVRITDRNLGKAPAPAHDIQLTLHSRTGVIQKFKLIRGRSIAPRSGRHYRRMLRLKHALPPGARLCVFTDARRKIRESNERNNKTCVAIKR